jgi:drug/metabolite transporter (DMT)-like permease
MKCRTLQVNCIPSIKRHVYCIPQLDNNYVSVSWQYVNMTLIIIGFIASALTFNISQNITLSMYGPRFSFFVGQFTNICRVPLCFILYKSMVNTDKRHIIEQLDFPKKYYFGFAILDSFGIILLGLGSPHIPGPLENALNQVTIPISLISTYIIMKKNFRWQIFVGIPIIFVGMIWSIIGSNAFTEHEQDAKIGPCLIYLLGNVCFGISFVLKEWFMRNADIKSNPYHMLFWVSVIVVPISFTIYPIQTVIGEEPIPLLELPQAFFDGFKCMIGIDNHNKDCALTFIPLLIFTLSAFVYSVMTVLITKQCSALIQYIVQSITIPIYIFCYSLPIVMPDKVDSFTQDVIIGLIIILVGQFIYVFGDPDVIDKKDILDKENPKFDQQSYIYGYGINDDNTPTYAGTPHAIESGYGAVINPNSLLCDRI